MKEYIVTTELGANQQFHELIRCKDCRFWDKMPASTATPDYHLCRRPFQKIAMTEYDFCSKADRRDDD